MYILAMIDGLLIALLFYMTLFLPRPWQDYNIRNVAKPLIQMEKMTLNNYLLNNELENKDLTKSYHIYFNKSTKKFELKEWCWKININALWVSFDTQSYWIKYCVNIKQLHPLEFETVFWKNWDLSIKFR